MNEKPDQIATEHELRRVALVGDLPGGIEMRGDYPHDQKRDVRIVRGFMLNGTRYTFDWFLKPSDGWCQMDTDTDASYYGHWINPHKRAIISFVEGDVIVTVCATVEAFVAEVTGHADFHTKHAMTDKVYRNGKGVAIDTFLNEENNEAFERLGLSEFLH